MQARLWSDVLKLLAMMVIGGQETLRDERNVFAKAALSLRGAVYPKLHLTKLMAVDWLDVHREEMDQSMNAAHFEDTLNGLLLSLSAVPDKRSLILTMLKTTVSESGRSPNENRIIGGMNYVWGIPKPIGAACNNASICCHERSG